MPGHPFLGLVGARLAEQAGAAHQFDRVILGHRLGDPVVAVGAAQAGEHVAELVHQGAGAVFADQRPVGVQEQRPRARQATAPHRVTGADDKHLDRQLAVELLELRHQHVEEGQHVVAPDFVALGAGDADLDVLELLAPGADVAGDDPAGRAVEAALGIGDDEGLAVAAALEGRVHVAPALGQLEAQAGARIGALGRHHRRRRHQVVAAQERPVGGHAGVVATAAALVVDGVQETQAGRFAAGRHPGHHVALAGHFAVAANVGIAIFRHAQAQAPDFAGARGQADADVGLALVGQETHQVVHAVFGALGQDQGGQQQQGQGHAAQQVGNPD